MKYLLFIILLIIIVPTMCGQDSSKNKTQNVYEQKDNKNSKISFKEYEAFCKKSNKKCLCHKDIGIERLLFKEIKKVTINGKVYSIKTRYMLDHCPKGWIGLCKYCCVKIFK